MGGLRVAALAAAALAWASAASAAVTMTVTGSFIDQMVAFPNGPDVAAAADISIPSTYVATMVFNEHSNSDGTWNVESFSVDVDGKHFAASSADAGWNSSSQLGFYGTQFGAGATSTADFLPGLAGNEQVSLGFLFHLPDPFVAPPTDPAEYLAADSRATLAFQSVGGQVAYTSWETDQNRVLPPPTSVSFDGAFIRDVVPEPGAWALMLVGFGAAGAALRRRLSYTSRPA